MAKEVDKKLETILKEIREFKESLSFLNKSFEELKGEIGNLLKKQNELEKENAALKMLTGSMKQECKALRSNFEYIEREKVSNIAEIAGIPDRENENLFEVVNLMAKNVGFIIDKTSIIGVTRTNKKKKDSASSGKYPPDIHIAFANKEMSSKFISIIKKSKMNSSDLGFGRNFKIFAREQLTFYAKQLFYKCLEFKRLKNWKFLWTKDGRIFLREKEGGKCYLITDFADLDSVIG